MTTRAPVSTKTTNTTSLSKRGREGERKTTSATRGFHLHFLSGPLADSSGSPSTVTYTGSTFRIGRTKASKVQIKDETVSEVHGVVRWSAKKGGWEISDSGSSNGTSVRGMECTEGVWVGLESGDEVRIGEQTVVRFEFFDRDGKGEGLPLPPTLEDNTREKQDGVATTEITGKRKKKGVVAGPTAVDVENTDANTNGETVTETVPEATGVLTTDRTYTTAKTTHKTTVLEHIEAHCAKLERDLLARGAKAVQRLQEAWETEKRILLEKLS